MIGNGDLDRWEAAWLYNGSPADTRVFLSGLLTSGEAVLLAIDQGDRTGAGYLANRTPPVAAGNRGYGAEAPTQLLGLTLDRATWFD